MAIITCPQCLHQIDDTVKSCPTCRFNIRKYLKGRKKAGDDTGEISSAEEAQEEKGDGSLAVPSQPEAGNSQTAQKPDNGYIPVEEPEDGNVFGTDMARDPAGAAQSGAAGTGVVQPAPVPGSGTQRMTPGNYVLTPGADSASAPPEPRLFDRPTSRSSRAWNYFEEKKENDGPVMWRTITPASAAAKTMEPVPTPVAPTPVVPTPVAPTPAPAAPAPIVPTPLEDDLPDSLASADITPAPAAPIPTPVPIEVDEAPVMDLSPARMPGTVPGATQYIGRLFGEGASTPQNQLFGERPGTPQNQLFGERPGTPQNQLFGERPGTPQNQLFGERPSTPQNQLFGERSSTPQNQLFGEKVSTPQNQLFGEKSSTPQNPLFGEKVSASQGPDQSIDQSLRQSFKESIRRSLGLNTDLDALRDSASAMERVTVSATSQVIMQNHGPSATSNAVPGSHVTPFAPGQPVYGSRPASAPQSGNTYGASAPQSGNTYGASAPQSGNAFAAGTPHTEEVPGGGSVLLGKYKREQQKEESIFESGSLQKLEGGGGALSGFSSGPTALERIRMEREEEAKNASIFESASLRQEEKDLEAGRIRPAGGLSTRYSEGAFSRGEVGQEPVKEEPQENNRGWTARRVEDSTVWLSDEKKNYQAAPQKYSADNGYGHGTLFGSKSGEGNEAPGGNPLFGRRPQ